MIKKKKFRASLKAVGLLYNLFIETGKLLNTTMLIY
jgi:hypothetical protein